MYQIQLVVERSKPDLYALLDDFFREGNSFKKIKIRHFLLRSYDKSIQMSWSDCSQGIDI